MKNKELQNILLSVGFSQKEIHTYLALLELGRETVARIARKAGINRTTAYVILDSLVEKGVVSISGKEPKQEYIAESPEKLLDYLKAKIDQEKKSLLRLESSLPELIGMHNVSGRPSVRFYEGKEGLKEVYEDTLSSTEPIRAYAHLEPLNETMGAYFPEYYNRRAKKKIQIRAIFPDTPEGRERHALDKKELRESVLVPKDIFSGAPEINIYDNKIMIASWKEKLGIIIESEEIAKVMKKIYELAWAEAKRLSDKI